MKKTLLIRRQPRQLPAESQSDIATASQRASSLGDDMNGARHVRIAECAYALYVQRGREDGHDLDDWLQAEAIIRRRDARVLGQRHVGLSMDQVS